MYRLLSLTRNISLIVLLCTRLAGLHLKYEDLEPIPGLNGDFKFFRRKWTFPSSSYSFDSDLHLQQKEKIKWEL